MRECFIHTMVCALFTVLTTDSMAETAERAWAISPSLNSSSDSDGLNIHKVSLAALPAYSSGLQWQGMEWQTQRYQQNASSIDGHTVSYGMQSIEAKTGMGSQLKLGLSQQGSSSTLLITDWNHNQSINENLNWGLTANRDWVESMTALQQNTYFNLVGANLDYQLHPRVTLVGAINQTWFSDSHQRQQKRFRAIWDTFPDQGITLQWSYKHQTGESLSEPTYFNPDQLDESIAIVGWRRRIQGWQIYARLGAGNQSVNTQSNTPTRLSELQVTSPLNGPYFLKFRLGSNETYGLNGPNYLYRFADVQWIWRLGR
jgi:hypothetical protein